MHHLSSEVLITHSYIYLCDTFKDKIDDIKDHPFIFFSSSKFYSKLNVLAHNSH